MKIKSHFLNSFLMIFFMGSLCSTKGHAQLGFPADIQSEFDSGNYTLDQTGFLNSFANYYFYSDSAGRQRFAIEYSVGNQSIHDLEGGFGGPIPLYGKVWIAGLRTSSSDDGGFFSCGVSSIAGFTMYLEQVRPIQFPISNFPEETFFVSLNREALLQSHGSFSWLIDERKAVGNMCSEGPWFCLGTDCEIGGMINMIGLEFEETSPDVFNLVLNFSDSRTELYSHYSSAPDFKGKPGFLTCQKFELGCATGGSGIPGDVTGDFEVNLLDVSSFVCALQTGNYVEEADVSGDGFLTLLDVIFFVDILSNL